MKTVVWLAILGVLIFLTFNMHSKSGYFNYHSEIWSDKAGYYVYLPGALKYNFDPQKFPAGIDTLTGHGFKLDFENKKVLTKYNYGVALLVMPFYLLADFLAPTLSQNQDGFSPVYHWAINVASVFYLVFALYLLYIVICSFQKKMIAFIALASVFLGTHLYYYSINETGMSHVYSFFLFSAAIYLAHSGSFFSRWNLKKAFLIGLTAGLIVVIRPVNALFLLALPLIGLYFEKSYVETIRALLNKRLLTIALAGFVLAFIPQFLYWYESYGSFFYYSYKNEGFNFGNPMLMHTWFSPNNGLFLYTPLYVLILIGIALQFRKSTFLAIGYLLGFMTLSYILSSWWDWGFGCSFGARSFVEYGAFFVFPLTTLYSQIAKSGILPKVFVLIVVLGLVGYNLKMTYSYDECFYGERIWDWDGYLELLKSPTR